MLYRNIGNGRSSTDNKHRRATNGGKLIEKLEEILLDNSRPNQTTRIGTLASLMVHRALSTFLKKNQDVFTWSHEDILGIDLSVMVHS